MVTIGNTNHARPFATKRSGKSSLQLQLPRASHGATSGRSKIRSHPVSKMARNVYANDFLAVLLLVSMATMYVLVFEAGEESSEFSDGLPVAMPARKLSVDGITDLGPASISPQRNNAINIDDSGNEFRILPVKESFEQYHENAPVCSPLEDHEVTYSLAIALPESNLNMVSHHCNRWGFSAPISIAVWTDSSPEEIMKKLKSFPYNQCRPAQMTITTLAPSDGSGKPAAKGKSESESETAGASSTYPLNQLRNLAIQGIQTTHAIPLDIEMWSSVDLHDVLHSPSTAKAMAQNPKLAMVLPAFEIKADTARCSSRKKCIQSIPGFYDDLILQLNEKTVSVMAPEDKALQGSTLYRSWIRQDHGELVTIDCVSSQYYEPYLAVRYCEGLPPFQEVLKHDDYDYATQEEKDDAKHDLASTWMLHLLRTGYAFKQVGGGFVVKMPQIEEDATITTLEAKQEAASHDTQKAVGAKNDNDNDNAALPSLQLRTANSRRRLGRTEFLQWLEKTVPDHRSMQKCDDFEDSEDEMA